jgi:hypothetical protein
MADDGTAAVVSQRPATFAAATRRAHPKLGRLAVLLTALCCAVLLLAYASQTILGRYLYYCAEDAAVAARKGVRHTVDTVHNWWHHVQKTVAKRDKKRAATELADTDRWIGTVETR